MRLIKCSLMIRKGNNMICIGKEVLELEALISEVFEAEMVLSFKKKIAYTRAVKVDGLTEETCSHCK